MKELEDYPVIHSMEDGFAFFPNELHRQLDPDTELTMKVIGPSKYLPSAKYLEIRVLFKGYTIMIYGPKKIVIYPLRLTDREATVNKINALLRGFVTLKARGTQCYVETPAGAYRWNPDRTTSISTEASYRAPAGEVWIYG